MFAASKVCVSSIAIVVMCFMVNISSQESLGLPSYITGCKRNDSKIDECATEAARSALVPFLEGDPDRNISKLNPMIFEEVKLVSGGQSLNIVLNDVKLYGLPKINITKVNVDLENQKITMKLYGNLKLDSKYEMKGKILVLPITGKGDSRIMLEKTKLKYILNYTLETGDDNKEYMKINNTEIKFHIGKASFKFENLFNGDKFLGDSANKILNESWKSLINEFGPIFVENIRNSISNVLDQFFSTVSYDEIFPID